MNNSIFSQEEMITLQNLLKLYKKTITTAESCTGGLIASKITEIAGSSNIFNGSIVSYSNKIKSQELNVKEKTLEDFGAVSVQVVEEMLEGAIKKFSADYAIAVSGIAGPDGGTKNKPVGTVVIGVMGLYKGIEVDIYHFKGNRNEVQQNTANKSLEKLLKFFQKTLDK